MVDLTRGVFDDEIRATPGTGDFRVVTAPVLPRQRPTPARPPTRVSATPDASSLSEGEPTAAAHFRRGLSALRLALSHWATAARLDPENQTYRDVQLMPPALVTRLHSELFSETADPAPPSATNLDIRTRREAAGLFESGLARLREGDRLAALTAWQRAAGLDQSNRSYRVNIRRLKRQAAPPE